MFKQAVSKVNAKVDVNHAAPYELWAARVSRELAKRHGRCLVRKARSQQPFVGCGWII